MASTATVTVLLRELFSETMSLEQAQTHSVRTVASPGRRLGHGRNRVTDAPHAPDGPPVRPAQPRQPTLARRLSAEALGTLLLVTIVVGSGIAAERLSPGDVGLQLLENSTATAFGLTVLILMFGPTSGAHFNPVVSLADWYLGRRTRTGLTLPEVSAYSAAQVVGGIAGAALANLMFDLPVVEISTKPRTGNHLLLGELVATTGLVALIFILARTGRGALAAPAVGIYIGAAYWFTSSTSFANPAVTIGRAFTDTFAGIAPTSVIGFLAAQVVGAVLAVLLVRWFHPDVDQPGTPGADTAARAVLPHPTNPRTSTDRSIP